MHAFYELVERCVNFTLRNLDDLQNKTIEELQTSGSTRLVKNLQMIELQKSIMIVGMFSLLESITQDRFDCKDGFKEIEKVLSKEGECKLAQEFNDFKDAVNVLKHGKGTSYNRLVERRECLNFRIRLPDENFFHEGDVSEIFTLIQVDNKLILECSRLITAISEVMRRRPVGWY